MRDSGRLVSVCFGFIPHLAAGEKCFTSSFPKRETGTDAMNPDATCSKFHIPIRHMQTCSWECWKQSTSMFVTRTEPRHGKASLYFRHLREPPEFPRPFVHRTIAHMIFMKRLHNYRQLSKSSVLRLVSILGAIWTYPIGSMVLCIRAATSMELGDF